LTYRTGRYGPHSYQTAKCYKIMAIATRKMEDYEVSLEYARRAVKYTERALGEGNHKTLDVKHTRALTLYEMGNYTKAVDIMQKVYTRALQNSSGSETTFSAKVMNDMSAMTPKPGSSEWDTKILIKHLEYAHVGIAAYRSINQVRYAHTTLIACSRYSNYESCTGIGARERNHETQAALARYRAMHQQPPVQRSLRRTDSF
jgi:tetratricopeptide (TPR) repeat protein